MQTSKTHSGYSRLVNQVKLQMLSWDHTKLNSSSEAGNMTRIGIFCISAGF